MPTSILDKYSTSAALTMTLASLASSATGVGRQSTVVDNATTRYQQIMIYLNVKLGTSPTANKGVYVYAIRGDKDATTAHRDDGAGATDAGLTVKAAKYLGMLPTGTAPATGDVLKGSFVIDLPGPEWGLALAHDTGVALDATGTNHWARWIGANSESQ